MNYLGSTINPRVGQLDASLLDSELLDQLKTKLVDALKVWRPDVPDTYESEILLGLRLLLFKVTIWDHATTYGGKLQNLMLTRASTGKPIGVRTKALYGCITILGSYLWSKLNEKQIISINALSRLSFLWNAASLYNFVAFLYSGRYITIVLRLIGAELSPASRAATRNVNYEFQNRQLVWNALTEFLLFALPMVNFRKLQRKILKAKPDSDRPLSFLPRKTCAICYEQNVSVAAAGVTNPHTAGCEHLYCFVCLSLRLSEDSEWPCARCGKTLSRRNLQPLSAGAAS